MKLTQISKIAENDHDAIVLILSSCFGFGHKDGALLKLKQLIQAAVMILEYLRRGGGAKIYDYFRKSSAYRFPC